MIIQKKINFLLYKLKQLRKEDYTLEIHVTDHCNLNCKSCNHYSPLSNKNFINLIELEKNLKILYKKQAYKLFKNVYLLGGEPLLNKQLTDIINLIRIYFPHNYTKIKIITNGILLNKLPNKFWESCRNNNIIISITQYPINLNYDSLKEVCAINSIEYEIFGNRGEENAFTQYKLKYKNYYFINHIYNFYQCNLNRCLQLVNDKIYMCSPCAYVEKLNLKIDKKFKYRPGDYLKIKYLNKYTLYYFLMRPKPFCRYCEIKRDQIPWSISKKEVYEWLVN